MSHHTAKEIKQNCVKRMGEPLGSLFYALWNEVNWLYLKWSEYLELYGTKPSRVELMNRAAPSFFRVVQDTLWENILLHVARLTDKPKSAGKPNLTIRRLEELIKEENAAQNIHDLTKKAIQSAEFCRDWRNRHIAHRDLNLAIEKVTEPLSSASCAQVKVALSAIAEVMNTVEQQHTDLTTSFKSGINQPGAKALLYLIDDGLKAKKERLTRLKCGKYSDEDFKPRDI